MGFGGTFFFTYSHMFFGVFFFVTLNLQPLSQHYKLSSVQLRPLSALRFLHVGDHSTQHNQTASKNWGAEGKKTKVGLWLDLAIIVKLSTYRTAFFDPSEDSLNASKIKSSGCCPGGMQWGQHLGADLGCIGKRN